MKKLSLIITSVVIALLFYLPLKASWTYMVYIAADNSLSSYADSDISEMEQASDNSDVNIIVLVDQNGNGDSKVIKIHNGGSTVITPTSESWWPSNNELSTDDWNVAKDFFLWAMQNYPADHYAITFWDHGGGIFKGNDSKKSGPNSKAICWDDHGIGDYIDAGEVRQIVQALYLQNGNQKIDLIGYDVCIVGAIETHYQTEDMVHVSVASGASEPGDGWDWTFMKELANNSTMNARTLGNYIVQYFGNYYPSTDATLGALDDDTLNAVFMPVFNSFVSELYNNMYDYQSAIQTDRNNCSESLNSDEGYGGPTPDFRDFASRIADDASLPTSLRNAAADAVNAFDRTVINSYSHGYTFNGASIWFPKSAPNCGSSFAGDNWTAYGNIIEFHNTQWDEFLLQYANPQQVLPVSISYESHIIDDASGNGNGKLDQGETADIIVTLHNGGTSDATNVAATLTTTNSYVTITDANGTYGTIASNGSANNNTNRYTVQIASDAPDGIAGFGLSVTADGGYSTDLSFNSTVGNPQNIFVWDGNAANVSGTYIKNYLESKGYNVTYSTGNLPADYSEYDAIFLCFGIYSNNHPVSTTEATNIANYLNAGGKAYLEGGDILGYDAGKDTLMPYCGVSSANDGSSMGLPLSGQSGSVAEGMTFSAYTGGNNYIDTYTIGSGTDAFTNGGNTYAVQYDQGSYKTVTFAFELGGLTDASSPSTKDELTNNIINFLLGDSTATFDPPANLHANPGDGIVELTWDAPSKGRSILNASRLEKEKLKVENVIDKKGILMGYNIWRSLAQNGSYTKLNSNIVTNTNYSDNTVTNGTTYWYYVTAVYDDPGESGPSNKVSAFPHSATPSNDSILVIDDDGSCVSTDYDDITNYYTNYLDSKSIPYRVIEVDSTSGPGEEELSTFGIVIWLCGETWNSTYDSTLTPTDESSLGAYLSGGGKLLLVAQDYLYDRYSSATSFSPGQFPYDYLKLTGVNQDATNDSANITINGVNGSLADGMSFPGCETPFGNTLLYPDDLTGENIAFLTDGTYNFAIQYSDSVSRYKVAFSTFELSAIPSSKSTGSELLDAIMTFFNYGSGGINDAIINKTPKAIYRISNNGRNLSIEFSLQDRTDINISVINLSGRTVKKIKKTFDRGLNKENISMDHLSNGVYFVKLLGDSISRTSKIAIIK